MASVRRVAVLTTGRQDYGILRSTILLLRQTPEFTTLVWAGGTHYMLRCSDHLEYWDGER